MSIYEARALSEKRVIFMANRHQPDHVELVIRERAEPP